MDEVGNQELSQDVIQTAEALGGIAQNEDAFRLLVESFRAQDHEVFRDLLDRYKMLDRCHLVCKWICSKECVFGVF